MTTKEKTKRTIHGTIADLSQKKDKNGKPFYEVSLQQEGLKYPTKARAFREEMVTRFDKATKGVQIGLEVEEEQGEWQGKPVTYRDIVGIVPFDGLAPVERPASQPKPQNAPTGAGRASNGHSDDRNDSIERQVIFKEARAAADRLTALDAEPAVYVENWEYLFIEGLRIFYNAPTRAALVEELSNLAERVEPSHMVKQAMSLGGQVVPDYDDPPF